MQINGSGEQLVEFLNEQYSSWGNRRYTYNAPFLPKIGRPAEYWCSDLVDFAWRYGLGFNFGAYCTGFPSTIAAFNYYWESPYFITKDVHDTEPGDVFIMLRNGTPFHTGFRNVGEIINNYVPTFEGDTSSPQVPGSDSVGGVLTPKSRYIPTYSSNGLSMHWFRPPYTGKSGDVKALAVANSSTMGYTSSQLSKLAALFHVGATSNDVTKALQHHLNAYHGGSLEEDGLAGPLTVRALQQVLNHYGAHLDVDGISGPLTSAALDAQLAKGTI